MGVARRGRNEWGLSLTELMVVTAIFGVFAVVALPSFLSYWRASTLTAGAQELQALLNGGRQLAIRRNTTVCVEQGGMKVRYRVGGCTGTVWTGAGTDADGWFTMANGVEVTQTTADVVFNHVGAANPAGTYTVRNPVEPGRTLTVTVAASGRISIP